MHLNIPQMSPLLWLNLYVFFSLILFTMITMNFFFKSPFQASPMKANTPHFNWKW